MSAKYDVAAYIWPAYTGKEPRAHMFWPEKYGEWQTVKKAQPKFAGHLWPRKPLWGYLDEADPSVMENQIEAAFSHGVNVFIYDWYWYDRRPFLEQCLNEGYLKARNNEKVKFYLMWANHDAMNLWDYRLSDDNDTIIWEGKVNQEEFIRLSDRLIRKYFSLPNYYAIDSRPVFQIYDIATFINGLGGLSETKEALLDFRRRAKLAGLPGLWLMATIWGDHTLNLSGVDNSDKSLVSEAVTALGFDGITHYQYVHFANIDQDYAKVLPEVITEWERVHKAFDIPYFPHVSLGWDNNPRHKSLRPGIMTNCLPSEIKKAFDKAKAFVDSHPGQAPLVTVNSWNEWTEASYLQPDDIYGYGYLEAVRDVFGKYLQ
ncbi:MAG: glycoside hydrolase family 99-like domain-containing protein [Lachnospiraceae bacterium]|nr:glycoside hydrolase family 99-like domain-containing protein [Lachnospiraceae bacterium]